MLKIFSIVGTRPELIRLSRIMPLLDKFFDHTIIHTGQNFDYELNQIFFEDLNIRKPDVFLNAAGSNAAETIGNVISKIDVHLAQKNPDAILILGDTNSSLSAISAKRRRIPIFHMEAGNRCFDFNVPEEVNRRIVDAISDINLTYSKIAREYLIKEGFPAAQIIVTGSPMREVLSFYKNKIEKSKILDTLCLEKKGYFLVSTHRQENVDDPQKLKIILSILENLAKKHKMPVIVSTHPRTKEKLEQLDFNKTKNIHFNKPFSFTDYVSLQINARCTLSDSGTITEESSILGFPAINLRDCHERPEGFEKAAVIFTGLSVERVEEALTMLDSGEFESFEHEIVDDYKATDVSAKLVKIIISYTHYVKRYVWNEEV